MLELRIATRSQNSANKPKSKRKASSIYKGVSKEHGRNKWRASIRVNYEYRHLGSFDTEREAAIAYNKAALEAWGEYALLNDLGDTGIKD